MFDNLCQKQPGGWVSLYGLMFEMIVQLGPSALHAYRKNVSSNCLRRKKLYCTQQNLQSRNISFFNREFRNLRFLVIEMLRNFLNLILTVFFGLA